MFEDADDGLAYGLARSRCELGISIIPYFGFLGGRFNTEETDLDATGIIQYLTSS